jgi:hypothetical protein
VKQWPWPGDDPVVRARKCTWAYRQALLELKPEAAAELDDRLARQWGERWIAGHVVCGPDDWVTAAEAGQILGISAGRVSRLRALGRIKGVLEDGKRFKYKVSDLHELAGSVRSKKGGSPDTVNVSGPGAPTEEAVSSETPLQVESAHQPSIMCERLHPGETCKRFDVAVAQLSKINQDMSGHR